MAKKIELVTVKGFTLPKGHLEDINEFDRFPIRDQDVWIIGTQKSGTRWLSETAWMLLNDLDYEGAKQDLALRVPHLQMSSNQKGRNYDVKGKEEIAKDTLGYIQKYMYPKGPVCLHTHMPWVLLPREIRDGIRKPKIIYVARNPKDTMVSNHNWSRTMTGNQSSLEDFCKRCLTDKYAYMPYWRHILQFWERRNEPNILFLRYEDMRRDLPAVLRQIADFLGKSYTDEHIAKLTDHLSFESMKNNPAVNFEEHIKRVRSILGLKDAPENHHIRSGKIGGYKEVLSPEMIKQIDAWTEENTKNTDYVADL